MMIRFYSALKHIYHYHISKEKCVPKVPGLFSDNFLFKELGMEMTSLL